MSVDEEQTIAAIVTTSGSLEEARRLSRGLVEARLVACVQIEEIESHYRWEGAVEQAAEFRLTAKTRSSLVGEVMRVIAQEHSYELPELVTEPVAASEEYVRWVYEETKSIVQ